jgi:chromosome segregation ATPase
MNDPLLTIFELLGQEIIVLKNQLHEKHQAWLKKEEELQEINKICNEYRVENSELKEKIKNYGTQIDKLNQDNDRLNEKWIGYHQQLENAQLEIKKLKDETETKKPQQPVSVTECVTTYDKPIEIPVEVPYMPDYVEEPIKKEKKR